MGISEKIWTNGVSPKRASKMQLRDFDLNTISQVSDLAQLPDVLKFNGELEFNPYKSWGGTSRKMSHPSVS